MLWWLFRNVSWITATLLTIHSPLSLIWRLGVHPGFIFWRAFTGSVSMLTYTLVTSFSPLDVIFFFSCHVFTLGLCFHSALNWFSWQLFMIHILSLVNFKMSLIFLYSSTELLPNQIMGYNFKGLAQLKWG